METTIIDFDIFTDELFVGYENGKKFREILNLEFLDDDNTEVEIIVSNRVYSMSSSFLRGFLGESIVKAGTRENFYKKYHFKNNHLIMGLIENLIVRHTFRVL